MLELARTARAAADERQVLVTAESEPQNATLFRSADHGGCEVDALWSDDFHHAARVRLTGRSEAYYSDYAGSSAEFAAAARWGYLFQGQRYAWQNKRRGSPALDIRPERFVHYLQNHDQIANSPRGQRIHELTSPGRLRAMTALLLLMPQTPLLFQGQEFASSAPFLYFNDCSAEEAPAVAEGRAKFLAQFRSYALPEIQAILPDPVEQETLRAVQARFFRARAARWHICAASGLVAPPPRTGAARCDAVGHSDTRARCAIAAVLPVRHEHEAAAGEFRL